MEYITPTYHMTLNINKLSKEIEGSKFNKVEIAKRCGIDRKTIENVLAGRDPKLSTIISLASFLNIKISYLFDEEVTEIREAGRDYVEKGNIKHEGTEYYAPVTVDNGLAAENAELKRKLIEAQDKIIKLMEDRK